MLEAKGFKVKKSNIQDASWGKFIEKLVYKAESADKLIVKIDPKSTSKMCSKCGHIKTDLILTDRKYNCESCGLAIDRDINAAVNIKWLGTSLSITNLI
jgi:putative transposase